MARKKTGEARETGTVAEPTTCPNCGANMPEATKMPDGALDYGVCKKCHADPEKAAAGSTSAVARERGTDVDNEGA